MGVSYQARAAIKEEYVLFDVPADQIVSDTTLAEQFANRVNSHLPAKQRLTVDECKQATLNLRKRGSQKGGLPQLRGGHGPSKGFKNKS